MRLKEYLTENGISQRDFSKRVNIHYMYLNMVLVNKRRPSPDLADRIEKATDGEVTVMELLYPDREKVA